jgi:hypothetical protein
MGGDFRHFVTLHEVISEFEKHKQTDQSLTEHDFIIDTDGDRPYAIIQGEERAKNRVKRAEQARRSEFVSGLAKTLDVVVESDGRILRYGHVAAKDNIPERGGWFDSICGARVCRLKSPKHATSYEMCQKCVELSKLFT